MHVRWIWVLGVAACGGHATHVADAAGSDCPLSAATTPTSTVTNGCALLERDTSACIAARTARGLSGAC